MRVLDLGPPMEHKFAFFSRFHIRLYFNNFADSFYSRLEWKPQTIFSESDFLHMLPDCKVKYDLILAWDYLDYLTPDNLRLVTAKFTQMSHQGTWIYFLMGQHGKIPDQPATIDLLSSNSIRYTAGPAVREGVRYPPKVMEGLLQGFNINKLVLLKNGIQEHLFTYSSAR